MSELLQVSPAWRAAYPDAVVGVLAMRDVTNPPEVPAMSRLAQELEGEIRQRCGELEREALRAIAPLPAYASYYKRFGQRYHVAMQLESVALKGKPLPRVAALVEAMFVAELRMLILTAGHDLDAIARPIRLDVGTGEERYTIPGGGEAAVKPGDMYTADERSVLSAIVTGPAGYARIGRETTGALFVAYAPPGVERKDVAAHLAEIEANVRLIAPRATVAERTVVGGAT